MREKTFLLLQGRESGDARRYDNCEIDVGFKGVTTVSWSVNNAVLAILLEKCILAPLSPGLCGTSTSTFSPAVVAVAGGEGGSIGLSRSCMYVFLWSV